MWALAIVAIFFVDVHHKSPPTVSDLKNFELTGMIGFGILMLGLLLIIRGAIQVMQSQAPTRINRWL